MGLYSLHKLCESAIISTAYYFAEVKARVQDRRPADGDRDCGAIARFGNGGAELVEAGRIAGH